MLGSVSNVRSAMRLRTRWVVLACAATLVPALSGCQATDTASAAVPAGTGAASAAPVVRPSMARLSLSPASGSTDVRLDAPVTITVTDGTIGRVDVRTSRGVAVAGAMAEDGVTWVPEGGLAPATTYLVRAYAADAAGAPRSLSARFTTLRPSKIAVTSISPLSGRTVGVGHPIVVTLNADVDDSHKAAVEKGLQVTGTTPLDGAWSWQSDRVVHYRTKKYFPAHSTIRLNVRLTGTELSAGVWATSKTDRVVSYSTGASMVSVVDVTKHRMVVRRDGKIWAVFPVTTGKANFLTRGGVKVISEKYTLKVMDAATTGIDKDDPEYYRLDVPYAMRITNSGEFVHAAPWSEGSQGRTNVSHGCVGMSVRDAKRLFYASNVGDIVSVIHSSRPLNAGNGWTDWNGSWSDWLKKSALKGAAG